MEPSDYTAPTDLEVIRRETFRTFDDYLASVELCRTNVRAGPLRGPQLNDLVFGAQNLLRQIDFCIPRRVREALISDARIENALNLVGRCRETGEPVPLLAKGFPKTLPPPGVDILWNESISKIKDARRHAEHVFATFEQSGVVDFTRTVEQIGQIARQIVRAASPGLRRAADELPEDTEPWLKRLHVEVSEHVPRGGIPTNEIGYLIKEAEPAADPAGIADALDDIKRDPEFCIRDLTWVDAHSGKKRTEPAYCVADDESRAPRDAGQQVNVSIDASTTFQHFERHETAVAQIFPSPAGGSSSVEDSTRTQSAATTDDAGGSVVSKPLVNETDSESTTAVHADDSEWSPPLARVEVARRILRRDHARWRDVESLFKPEWVRPVEGKNKVRVCLDVLDASLRRSIETPWPSPQ